MAFQKFGLDNGGDDIAGTSKRKRAFKRRIKEEALFDSKTSIIISWSGMRGIVSLAIALGLPEKLNDGSPFPMRNEIIFISIAAVIISLLGQGLTLPWLVKRFYNPGDEQK